MIETRRDIAESIRSKKVSLNAVKGLQEMLASMYDSAGCGCNGTGGPGNGSNC